MSSHIQNPLPIACETPQVTLPPVPILPTAALPDKVAQIQTAIEIPQKHVLPDPAVLQEPVPVVPESAKKTGQDTFSLLLSNSLPRRKDEFSVFHIISKRLFEAKSEESTKESKRIKLDEEKAQEKSVSSRVPETLPSKIDDQRLDILEPKAVTLAAQEPKPVALISKSTSMEIPNKSSKETWISEESVTASSENRPQTKDIAVSTSFIDLPKEIPVLLPSKIVQSVDESTSMAQSRASLPDVTVLDKTTSVSIPAIASTGTQMDIEPVRQFTSNRHLFNV